MNKNEPSSTDRHGINPKAQYKAQFSAYEEVKGSFPHPQLITAIEHTRLAWRKSYRVVDHCAIDRTQVFHQKCVPFQPDARMPARYLGLRIESREIYFRKYVGMGIGPTQKITVLLQNERGVELSGSGYYQLCGGSRHMQHRAGTHPSERLFSTAVGAEDIIRSDATATKTTIDGLNLHRLAPHLRRWNSIAHSPMY